LASVMLQNLHENLHDSHMVAMEMLPEGVMPVRGFLLSEPAFGNYAGRGVAERFTGLGKILLERWEESDTFVVVFN
jgi:hypothetical protein